MGRSPCCEKAHTNRGAWTKEEDMLLISYIRSHGEGCWRSLPKAAGLQRCGKSCRLRWINYLRPDLKRGNFSEEEDQIIVKLHKQFGNKWSLIASHLPGRTDNEIKNYWNTHVKRKLAAQGELPGRSCHVLVGNGAEHARRCCSGGATGAAETEQVVTPHPPAGAPDTAAASVASGGGTPSKVDVGLDLDLSISLPWDTYAAAALQQVVATGEEEEKKKVALLCGHVGFDRVDEGCNLCGGSTISYPPAFRCYI